MNRTRAGRAVTAVCMAAIFLSGGCTGPLDGAPDAADAGTHVEHKPEKVVEHHHPGGQIRSRRVYVVAGGRDMEHGPQSFWYENGQKRLEVNYKCGRRHGSRTEWALDGRINRLENYQDGLQEGRSATFHRNGRESSAATYRAGRVVGSHIYWDKDGRARREVRYDARGNKSEVLGWYPDGRRSMSGTFCDGKPHGTWVYWGEDGVEEARGEWRKGSPWDGVCRIPQAGDAGSWAGLDEYARYEGGRLVAKLDKRPTWVN